LSRARTRDRLPRSARARVDGAAVCLFVAIPTLYS